MSVTSVDTDYDSLTITLIADFDASIERVWALWSDPRQLERWWGPPAHPATFETYDLTAGGEATYYMTGPEGPMWGAWCIKGVDPPTSLEFINAYADPDGTPVAHMPIFTVNVQAHRARRLHTDGDALTVRIARGHGEDGRHGHGRRPATGRRPNRRPPRVNTATLGADPVRARLRTASTRGSPWAQTRIHEFEGGDPCPGSGLLRADTRAFATNVCFLSVGTLVR